ncbi:glycoside hydrolase family 2 protein [Anaerosporobacter sp.]|uniref:glycoside hydrolase family 2 protein n=1 Tax=Anaerosporobacter sp. TaxID=1872529 RepID=UPI00289C21AE|nr:sugar-binding domain-containing protein [Anaerosporobacter sp.]
MKQLITKWGKKVDKKDVLKEYPRPNLVRDSYLNLNGEWEYAITKSKDIEKYDGNIVVPFSPEAYLSGVQRIVQPDDYLHYRCKFRLDTDFIKERLILHFGAVDQECEVFLNGIRIGEHKGGYLPFSFDITNEMRIGENTLTLCVVDRTEKAPHARGKQKLVKKGKYGSLFYTPNSGIWKTVWLESVSEEYITNLRVTPCFDESAITVLVSTNGEPKEANIRILFKDNVVEETIIETNKTVKIVLDSFKSWTPDEPNLYDIEIDTGTDKVTAYFGMRKFSTGKDKNGILRFFLNNKPYFFNGLLDQGYWPESLLTPPSDDALKYDIVKLKELGYNTIRKHIKIESERFYYHCDKIGMIVWQDMPNGGGDYNMVFVTYLPNAFNWFARGVKDSLYSLFKRRDEEGRRQYYNDLEGMVNQLYNHPSIAVWVPFNEGWGQFDANIATNKIRKLDSTRLVNEACGWFDQNGGDMYSIHNYIRKLKVKPQSNRVVALTEYGGYSYPVENHVACEKEFGYKSYKNAEELTENYKRLWEEEIYPNIKNGLCSAIYTQTSDIEEEINGLMTYDREIVKIKKEVVKALNQKLDDIFQKTV